MIGLVIGGILVGQDLIKAAQVRATVSQFERYETAANTFRIKYNCLPGDCANPSAFGLGGGCQALGTICGNGTIGGATDPGANTLEYRTQEPLDFWLQLSQAGLIEGTYVGATAAIAANNFSPGYAYPSTKMKDNVGIFISALGLNRGGPNYFRTNVNGTSSILLFLPFENYLIDSKMDDGFPNSGKVMLVTDYDGYSMPDSLFEVLAKDESAPSSFGPAGAISNFCATTDNPSQYNVANTTSFYDYPGSPSTPNCSIAVKPNF